MTTETGSDCFVIVIDYTYSHYMHMHTDGQTDTHVASHASQSQATQERSYVTLYQLKLQLKILLPSVYVQHSEPLSAPYTIEATERIPMDQSLPDLP
jgi:hypothetical protein